MRDSEPLSPQVVHLDPRDETESPSYVGMVVFLGSWAMMFAALFFSYGMIRSRAPLWPPVGEDPLPLLVPGINSAVAIISSITMQCALMALRRHRLIAFRHWMLMTLMLGIAFITLQCMVWTALWDTGLTLQSGIYGAVFYLLTCFHFIHVVVGLGLLVWLLSPSMRRVPVAPRRVPVRLASMFWHFVTIVWLLIYVAVYIA